MSLRTIDDFISSRCRLALLFLIFAIGSLFDHEHDKDYMVNSRDYYRLARAVYVSQSRDDTTLVSVQVLVGGGTFLCFPQIINSRVSATHVKLLGNVGLGFTKFGDDLELFRPSASTER